jgi:hypothetical protein
MFQLQPNISGEVNYVEVGLYFGNLWESDFVITFKNGGIEYGMEFDNVNDIFTTSLSLTEEVVVSNPQIIVEGKLLDGQLIRFKWVEFRGSNLSTSTTNITTENLDETFNVFNYNNTLNVKTREFENYTLEVYNLSGQMVFSETTNGNFKTNLSGNGFYIVKLEFENKILTKKIIVQ